MKLLYKFNLIVTLVMVLGFAISAWVSRGFLQQQARAEVLNSARLLLEQALAVRAYTSDQITRLLEPQMAHDFLPQAIPSYSATEVLNTLRAQHPEFAYKEAALNPINPRDRATGWEVEVVEAFRRDAALKEYVGERDGAAGASLYIARPLRIADANCLDCHGSAAAAPKALVAKYGPGSGYGWKPGEVVAAQLVSVPMAVPLQRADQALRLFVGSLIGVFVAVWVALNLLLWWVVVRPVTRLAALAERVSEGDLAAPEFPAGGRDEIGVLARALSRMRASLVRAMKMIDG